MKKMLAKNQTLSILDLTNSNLKDAGLALIH